MNGPLTKLGCLAGAAAVSLITGWFALAVSSSPRGPVSSVAWSCAVLSVFWFVLSLTPPWSGRWFAGRARLAKLHVTLFFAVASAIIQAVVLVMRCVIVVIDLAHGYPGQRRHQFGCDRSGLVTLGLLALVCAAGLVSTRDPRLATCLFWLLVMMGSWACLLSDPYQLTMAGGFERTDAVLLLCGTLAGIILLSVVAIEWLIDSKFFRCRQRCDSGEFESLTAAPGFRSSIAFVAFLITPVLFQQLLVPVSAPMGGFQTSALGVGGAAGVAAMGCLLLIRRQWGPALTDAAMGLLSIALCAVAVWLLPLEKKPLSDLYPTFFATLIIGSALGTALWTVVASRWTRSGRNEEAREGVVFHARRFAFHCAAVGLLACTMLTFWPRMPGIAAMDHSLERVLVGFGANLFLLLTMIRCSRSLQRAPFRLLTVVSAVSTIAFLMVRMTPFVSNAG